MLAHFSLPKPDISNLLAAIACAPFGFTSTDTFSIEIRILKSCSRDSIIVESSGSLGLERSLYIYDCALEICMAGLVCR